MFQIILALTKKTGVINLKQLVSKTGINENRIIEVLYILELKGKLEFAKSNMPPTIGKCTFCGLNNFCKQRKIKNDAKSIN